MNIICHHDPSDPNHLICESKRSPVFEWLRERWQQFYCAGPICPVHKAYAHLAVDIFLVITIVGLVVANLVFLSRGSVDKWNEGSLGSFLGTRSVEPGFFGQGNSPASLVLGPLERLDQQDSSLAGLRVSSEESQPNLLSGGEDNDESLLYSGQSRLFIEGEARYFSLEGEQLGRGPWPPKAGQETKIKVFLRTDVSSEFKNVVVSGRIAPNVKWTGFAPQGRGLIYEPATQTVRWQVGRVDAVGDLSEMPAVAIFELAITPNLSQIRQGQVLIMEDLKIRGISQITREERLALAPQIFLDIKAENVVK